MKLSELLVEVVRRNEILYHREKNAAPVIQRAYDVAMQYEPELLKLAKELRLKPVFKTEKISVHAYAGSASVKLGNEQGEYLMQIYIPLPDGLTSDDVMFYASMFEKAVRAKFNVIDVMFRTKSRSFARSAHEFANQVAKRRKPETAGDTMSFDMVVKQK